MNEEQRSAAVHEAQHEGQHERRGAPPVGTLTVIGVLLLAISTFWLLILGILEGRA